ncbi:MAG: AraC family transcriptional regulator, partial [Acutalibacteraceae bacterium]
MDKNEFKKYIFRYEPDELFYKEMYEKKLESEDALQKFIIKTGKDEIIKRRLYVPDMPRWFEDDLDKKFHDLQESTLFFDIVNNVIIQKHYRYTPVFMHKHDFFEVAYVYSGKCVNRFETVEQNLTEGDMCFIAPNTQHSIEVFDDSIIINLIIRKSTFEKTFFNMLTENDILSAFFMHTLYSDNYNNYLVFHTGGNDIIKSEIEDLFIEHFEQKKYYRRMLVNMLSVMFTHLLRYYETNIELAPSSEQSGSQVVEILKYIQDNFIDVTLTSAAEHFHFSTSYFSKLVKDYTGHNFTKILQNIKLEKSCRLLASTDLSVIKICDSVGYANIEHYNRTFKKQYGMTPSEYRRQI